MKTKTAYMTPEHIEKLSIKLWGKEGWRTKFQDFFDMSYSQLHRYMTVYHGQTIPKPVALALDMALTLQMNEIDLPDLKDYATPIADVKPIKFVPEKKPKVVRPSNDAPIVDLFGDDDETTETAPEPTEQQAPAEPTTEPAETKPEPDRTETGTKPARKPASKAKAKPAAPAKPKASAPAKKPAKSKKT